MDSISRAGRVLLGLSLPFLTLSGCQSMKQARDAGRPAAATAAADQAIAKHDAARMRKTDFEAKASKSQAFNTHIAMGKNAAQQGDYQLASSEFQSALDVSAQAKGPRVDAKGRAEAHRQLAKAFDHLGRFPQAEEHYQKAQKLAPKDPKVWNDLGYSYYLQRRYDLAEKSLRSALKLEENSAGIYTNLGLTLAAAGKTDEALSALSKMGGPAVGHANLGFMLAALGRTDEARSHYHKAVELQPNLIIVKTALARLDRPALSTTPPTAVVQTVPRASTDPALRRTSATPVKPQPVAAPTANKPVPPANAYAPAMTTRN